MIGYFSGDTGIFEGEDTFDGRPIRVRFTWSGVTTRAPCWEQALLRGRREDMGDELGHGVHADRRRNMECLRDGSRGHARLRPRREAHRSPRPASRSAIPSSRQADIAADDAGAAWRPGLARAALPGRVEVGRVGESGDLGFVTLHRCGEAPLPPRVDLGGTRTSPGRRSGRRQVTWRRRSTRGRSRGRTARTFCVWEPWLRHEQRAEPLPAVCTRHLVAACLPPRLL